MDIMHILLGSVALIGGTIVLCQLLRSLIRWKVKSRLAKDLLIEVVSTLQLSCCTREMVLLGTLGGIQLWMGLTLTYLLTVLHCMTFQGATCNPCGSLEQWLRAQASGQYIIQKLAAQFVGAVLSWVLMPNIWLLQLSPLHQWDVDCWSPLNMPPWKGALVEMTCALSLFLAMHFLPQVKPQYRHHVVALTITAIVWAGAPLTGAVFNPVLAFAVVFLCQGNSLLQYVIVYWIGPIIGTVVSVVILERGIPKLKRVKEFQQNIKQD